MNINPPIFGGNIFLPKRSKYDKTTGNIFSGLWKCMNIQKITHVMVVLITFRLVFQVVRWEVSQISVHGIFIKR